MNRVFGGSVFLAMLTVGVGSWAQSPMTPSRLNAPTPGSTAWVEPPPRPKPPAASSATAAAVPAIIPERQAATQPAQRPVRPPAQYARQSADSTADSLNRQELGRIRSGGGYPRGYSPWWGY